MALASTWENRQRINIDTGSRQHCEKRTIAASLFAAAVAFAAVALAAVEESKAAQACATLMAFAAACRRYDKTRL